MQVLIQMVGLGPEILHLQQVLGDASATSQTEQP